MGNSRIVLVIGATGAQGGAVARHLLARKEFSVRCLTRSPESEKAAALKKAGAEVVKGELDDPLSLRTAIDGASAVFGVTSYWEHFSRELEQGRRLVDAVATSHVEHFVLSTLPAAKQISGGKLEVPHLDMKAELENYTRTFRIPATFVHVAFYYENFLNYFPPQRQADGAFAFGFPQGDTPLAAVGVEDLGAIVGAILDRPGEFLGKTVGVVGEDRPPREYAEIMTRVLGQKIVYNHIPREVFASFGFPGAEDLANMFEFFRLYVPNRRADLEQCRALNPAMQRFEPWMAANKDRFAAILQRQGASATS